MTRLVTNPRHDGHFRTMAESGLASGAACPSELEIFLKREFPDACVVAGIREHGVERWYAYREGHWIDSTRAE
ncbi:MAG: hypothetical protein M3N29_05360 [Chloroflexota bacterium]|nr:hypothetical protein [Chloroflexota bacterium]